MDRRKGAALRPAVTAAGMRSSLTVPTGRISMGISSRTPPAARGGMRNDDDTAEVTRRRAPERPNPWYWNPAAVT